MSDGQLDPVVHRAVDDLRRLPVAEPEAIRRVIAAAAAARITPADEPLTAQPRDRSLGRWLAVSGVAAGLIGVAVIGAKQVHGRATPPPAATAASVSARAGGPASHDVRTVSSADLDDAPMPHQFVFQSATAHRISVVGDFNDWNPGAAPMSRDASTNLWSITMPIAPGRHVYGFMIDDSVFALDPQQPKTRDPDLGTNGSVIVVGKP